MKVTEGFSEESNQHVCDWMDGLRAGRCSPSSPAWPWGDLLELAAYDKTQV